MAKPCCTKPIANNDLTAAVSRTAELIGYAAGASDAAGNGDYEFNSSVVRTAAGRYTVTFATPHPQGDQYAINVTTQSDEPNRDQRKIGYTNKTANGFDVVTTIDDNGGAADGYADIPFDWHVTQVKSLITDIVGTTSTASLKQVPMVEVARAQVDDGTDIHNNGTPFVFDAAGDNNDANWARAANVLTYTGDVDRVRGTVSIYATDQGAGNYWARPSLRVTELVTGDEFIMTDLAMQTNGAYDGSISFQGSFVHKAIITNPSYRFEWFDNETRTATLIPDGNSQVVLEAIKDVIVLVVE